MFASNIDNYFYPDKSLLLLFETRWLKSKELLKFFLSLEKMLSQDYLKLTEKIQSTPMSNLSFTKMVTSSYLIN